MKREQGITMSGFLTLTIVLILAALLAFKVLPSYIEYFYVQKAVDAIAKELDLQTATSKEIRNLFDKRAIIDNITAVRGEDLEIVREGNESAIIADYSVKIPLVANITACIDFQASTAKRRKPATDK
ncbi:MAG TPA: DUF4845 domain-containing protein [Burkholderiales bacterium]|nr:DUF4845 domain-containing protein [Burkholderiales bacterium]